MNLNFDPLKDHTFKDVQKPKRLLEIISYSKMLLPSVDFFELVF